VAKPELRDHRKFLKLKRLLGEPTPHVLGYLECLWHRGYQIGNPVIGDALDVESAAEYPGEPGRFAEAAHEAGFLDRTGDGAFAIHDLFDHAPTYAKKRMHRKGHAPAGTNYAGISDPRAGTKSSRAGQETAESFPEMSRAGTETAFSFPHGTQSQEPKAKNQEPRTQSPKDSPPTPHGGAEAKRPRIPPEEFRSAWNDAATANGWRQCDEIGAKRLAALRQRAAKDAWLGAWRHALARAGPSEFLRGGGDRGWIADVDWFLRPETVTKILEGKYDNRSPTTSGTNGHPNNNPHRYCPERDG
jgi:hypothetical protein